MDLLTLLTLGLLAGAPPRRGAPRLPHRARGTPGVRLREGPSWPRGRGPGAGAAARRARPASPSRTAQPPQPSNTATTGAWSLVPNSGRTQQREARRASASLATR